MRKDDFGAPVAALQRQLKAFGHALDITSIYDDATEAAVIKFQRANGLVADGLAGPKTIATLVDGADARRLDERDLQRAAEHLGVPLAAIKAVNEVESRGAGFLEDFRPVILFERHVMYARLKAAGHDADALAEKYPNLVNKKRGGYVGKAGEYGRLRLAMEIDRACAQEACSWGQFQIMGYHWQALGYDSLDTFVADMQHSEGRQLDAFVRFIEADAELLDALKARQWPEFARIYNGPAYREGLYDVKLDRAYDRYAALDPASTATSAAPVDKPRAKARSAKATPAEATA